MRRAPGVSGLHRERRKDSSFARLAALSRAEAETELQSHLSSLRSGLADLNTRTGASAELDTDPATARQIQQLAEMLEVDLLGTGRSAPSFYERLAVQVVQVCAATRPVNGGVVSLSRLAETVTALRDPNARGRIAASQRNLGSSNGIKKNASLGISSSTNSSFGPQASIGERGKEFAVAPEDIARALASIESLGGGYRIVSVRASDGTSQRYVMSVPVHLATDHLSLLGLARENGGWFTRRGAIDGLGWSPERLAIAVTELIRDGVCLIDDQHESGQRAYWMG